jgi:hypothetical protein
MSEPVVTSFFKRFAVKFIEVVGAGIATALSGYLLAHFSGYWSAPASTPRAVPPTVQVAPNTGTGASTSIISKSQRAQPAHAATIDAAEQRLTSAPPLVVQPTRAAVSAKEKESAASHKQSPSEATAVESKPHDEKSVEAEVRAALANVDASRAVDVAPRKTDVTAVPPLVEAQPSHPAEADVTPHQIDVKLPPPPITAQPKPVDSARPAPAVALIPPAGETVLPPAEKAPPEPEPLAPVEIKSRPVAAVEASPPVAPVAAVKEEDKDILSMIKKIPDLLRPKPSASDGEAPRPPLPVGN